MWLIHFHALKMKDADISVPASTSTKESIALQINLKHSAFCT